MSLALAVGSSPAEPLGRPLGFSGKQENQGGEVDGAVRPGATRRWRTEPVRRHQEQIPPRHSPQDLGVRGGDALS